MNDDVNWLQYSAITAQVYNPGIGNQQLDLQGATIASSLNNDLLVKRDGSFYGVVYKTQTGDYVVAVRGTDDKLDWYANIIGGLGLPQFTQQFSDTLALVDDAQALANHYHTSVSLTGHSLGGGLAALAAIYDQVPAYVFDPAPFNAPNPVAALDYPPTLFNGGNFASAWKSAVAQYVHTTYLRGEALQYASPEGQLNESFNSDDSKVLDVGQVGTPGLAFESGAVGLHSISLLSLVEASLASMTDDATSFDLLLRQDRVLREDLVNTTNAGIAGPLNTPIEGSKSSPSTDIVFRALENSLTSGDGALYVGFDQTFGTFLDLGAAAAGLDPNTLTTNTVHSGIIALGLQVLRNAIKDPTTAGTTHSDSINNEPLAEQPLGDVVANGYAIAHLSDVVATDARQQASNGLPFGVDDLNHGVWDKVSDALAQCDKNGDILSEVSSLLGTYDQVFGDFSLFGNGKAQGLGWSVAVVQAGENETAGSAGMVYTPSDTRQVGSGGPDVLSSSDKDRSHLIIGGAGDDAITGSVSRDSILLGDGNNTVHATSGGDIIVGGKGSKLVYRRQQRIRHHQHDSRRQCILFPRRHGSGPVLCRGRL